MGQPIPPGDNVPLYEGLDSSWNDFVSVIPEDKRSAFAERVQGIHKEYEPLQKWSDIARSGITPEHADTAIRLFSTVENNPRQVLDTIAKHLGVTVQEAQQIQQMAQEVEEGDDDDPRIQRMQRQLDAMSQIMLAQRNQEVQSRAEAEADAKLDREIKALHKKYPDVDEEEILWRILQKDMTPEQAYQDFTSKVTNLRSTRPAPALLGQGGHVPRNAIDPTKLDPTQTKSLVAQMFEHANNERRSG